MKRLLEKGFKGLMLIAAIATGLSIGLFLCERDVKAAGTVSANSVSANLIRTPETGTAANYYESGYKVELQLNYTDEWTGSDSITVTGVELYSAAHSDKPLYKSTQETTYTFTDSSTNNKQAVLNITDVDLIDSINAKIKDDRLTDTEVPGGELSDIKAKVTFNEVTTGSGNQTNAVSDASLSTNAIYKVTIVAQTGKPNNESGSSFGSGVNATIVSRAKYIINPLYAGGSHTAYPAGNNVYCYKLNNASGSSDTLSVQLDDEYADKYYEGINRTNPSLATPLSMSATSWTIAGQNPITFDVTASSSYYVNYLPIIESFTITKPATSPYIVYMDSGNKTGHFDFEAKVIAGERSVNNNKIVAAYGMAGTEPGAKSNILAKWANQSPAGTLTLAERESSKAYTVDADVAVYSSIIDIKTIPVTAELSTTVTEDVYGCLEKAQGGTLPGAINVDKTTDTQIVKIYPYAAVNAANTLAKWQAAGNGYITVDQIGNLADLYKVYGADPNTPLDSSTVEYEWTLSSGSDKLTLTSTAGAIKGKAEGTATLTGKVRIKNRGDAFTSIGTVSVDVYPEPSIKYTSGSGSSRKLEITMPKKIAKAINSGDNFEDIKGFKLELLNSNKDMIAEYDLDKYKDVLKSSSSSSYTTTYTVSGSDLEELVNKASNNGKFSSESQDVYFSVIPVGKQVKAASTTALASDFRKNTDAIKVYQVSASGENMETTKAYGLADQEVKLTATPKSGYTFSKWSDGSTTNPRTIKVSSSTGSNKYTAQAVLGDRSNAEGGSNLAGYDDVPKTSESNAAIWLVILMVFAVIGGGYALYMQFRPSDEE